MPPIEARLRTLMLTSLGGDGTAYRELLHELSGHLRAYYRRRLTDGGADAEDLTQETLMVIHSRRVSYEPSQPFTAWVFAIARYKLVDHLRRGRVRATMPLEDYEDDLFSTDEQVQAEAARDVEQLLARLPERQREAIRLTKLEGLSVEEAATRTRQSAAATKVGVHRGLKRLRALLPGASSAGETTDADK